MAVDSITHWFAQRGHAPFAFQQVVWDHIGQGNSGLVHATTGSGKTLAVWGGLLQRLLGTAAWKAKSAPPLSVLWITPMRALAADSVKALAEPLQALAPHATLGLRTGDTPSAERARQDKRWPSALVTTPESLSLMLSRERCAAELGAVQAVVVDEWHELLGTKRGVQVQLALARLQRLCPGLVVWGMSATLGNTQDAMHALCGVNAQLVQGRMDKVLRIDALLPPNPGAYSWAGHLGARMVQPVVNELRSSSTSLVFTNTRSQAEIWYQLILQAAPELAGSVALHHGSLDKSVREWVEAELKAGRLRAVVATSSLDLGVDFLPVERVLQIGSAKGVARLLQRAGRSGHAPGRESRVTLVPTNTWELVEAAAARRAALKGQVESRTSPAKPLDVLVQHLVTVAIGGGFEPGAMYEEVRQASAYANLSRDEFDWAVAFCERGGSSLGAYPDYHRILPDANGIYRVAHAQISRRHKMAIGTIVSDASMQVKYLSGGLIGHMEEGFIARLNKGDCFVFAGKVLEFIRVQDMAAFVKRATKSRATVPAWQGGKMPLSTEMGQAVLQLCEQAAQGDWLEPELQAAQAMLHTQAKYSALPKPGELLMETFESKEGHHLYLYPFAGRQVHLGMASLLAWRLSQHLPNTFSMSVNDYGFELLSADPVDTQALTDGSVFSGDSLFDDVLASLNSSELAQRRFREIARISGLVFTGFPGSPKSMKQLQASSGLFFEVFKKYDPSNLLLNQAEREALNQELELPKLAKALQILAKLPLRSVQLARPSPLSLPLMVERLRDTLSTEQLSARLSRMLGEQLEFTGSSAS